MQHQPSHQAVPTPFNTMGGYPGPRLGLPPSFGLFAVPVDQLEQAWGVLRPTHLISITSPAAGIGLSRLPQGVKVHRAEFVDTNDPDEPGAPSEAEVRRILEFSRDAGDEARVLIHCQAGVSRSTATLFAVLVLKAAQVQQRPLRHLRPRALWLASNLQRAAPNRLVLAHTDRILGYNGRLARMATVVRDISDELRVRDGLTAFAP